MKSVERGQWVQMEMNMHVPRMERVHRRQIKQRAALLWDEIQKRKRMHLATPEKS
ncbi:MAG: hypothetical protein AAF558_04255 [Verrucomicrobiota bacterium]